VASVCHRTPAGVSPAKPSKSCRISRSEKPASFANVITSSRSSAWSSNTRRPLARSGDGISPTSS
jgi:hypothetical protein